MRVLDKLARGDDDDSDANALVLLSSVSVIDVSIFSSVMCRYMIWAALSGKLEGAGIGYWYGK